MSDVIFRTPEITGHATEAASKRAHLKAMTALRKRGMHVTEHVVTEPVPASVNHNRWCVQCDCGSGVAVHPEWTEQRCFGHCCGRVFVNVVFPPDRDAIEAELLLRRRHEHRNWVPGETVEMLRAEREAHS